MIRDLTEGAKHGFDLAAFVGVVVASVTLANAALLMSLIAATCSVMWFAIRLHDRIKYGPGE